MALTKNQRRTRIKNRIRKIVSGTETRPRLSVFRSNKDGWNYRCCIFKR